MDVMEVANDILLPEVSQLIAEGYTVAIRVKGASMRPLLKGGRDKVVLASAGELKRGDLVMVERAPGQYVLHRIVAIRENGAALVLMGDGNLGTEICRRTDVAGIVVTLIRNGRALNCNGFICRTYSCIWMNLRPLRRYLLAVYDRIG